MRRALTDVLDAHRDEVVALCRRFGVQRLDVFGSAASDAFDPARSDIDFLVVLEPPTGMTRFDAFFGLKESLETVLGRPVDLVDPSALDNPYFAAEVAATRQALYAA
jgi:predicted nucleotidyltransferase